MGPVLSVLDSDLPAVWCLSQSVAATFAHCIFSQHKHWIVKRYEPNLSEENLNIISDTMMHVYNILWMHVLGAKFKREKSKHY